MNKILFKPSVAYQADFVVVLLDVFVHLAFLCMFHTFFGTRPGGFGAGLVHDWHTTSRCGHYQPCDALSDRQWHRQYHVHWPFHRNHSLFRYAQRENVFFSLCVSVCLSVSLCVCLSQSLCLCLNVSLSVSVWLAVCLSVCLSLSLSLCLSPLLVLSPSLCLSSVCLSLSRSLRLFSLILLFLYVYYY